MKRKFSEIDETKSSLVSMYNNNIYFYGDVSKKNVLQMNEFIDELNESLYDKINIFIHSPGGDVYAGLSAMDKIAANKKKIETIADGFTASAATFILIGGHSRKMYKNCDLLIHQISTGTGGKYTELVDDMENNTRLMGKIKNIYETKTNIPEKKLKKLFEKEIVLDSELCNNWGIINEII